MLSNDTIEELNKLEKFIYDNDSSFLKEFTNIKYPDLIGVWFSGDSLKINYWDTDSGQHFSDIISMDDFNSWLQINEYEVLITAEMVKQLREMAEAPLSQCKRALIQTNGDVEMANLLIRNNWERWHK